MKAYLILFASFSAASRAALSASDSFFGGGGGQERLDIYKARFARDASGGLAGGQERGRATTSGDGSRVGGECEIGRRGTC